MTFSRIGKNIRSISLISAAAATLAMGGCTKDFLETNSDPNRLESITPGTLLNPTIYGAATYGMSRSRSLTFELMQVAGGYPNENVEDQIYLYDFREDVGNGIWTTGYKWLANAREIEKSASKLGNNNYLAIALTLKAWMYSVLTDCFGDVPMSDALSGEDGKFFPTFDRQEDIYKTMLADLERADTIYGKGSTATYAADLLYANDFTKWRKFTNSLRLRLLLRSAGRMPENYVKMAEIVNNPGKHPIFTANTDAAVLQITGTVPNISPWNRPQDFSTFRSWFDFFIKNLNEVNDPRLKLFASVARGKDNANLGYKGLPINYMESPTSVDFTPSGLLQRLVIAPMIVPIMSFAEVEFIKAELAQRGKIASSAETHYQSGVKAAIEMWGGVMPANYFDAAAAKYDGTLERIMLQKYYALFFTDYQQWFEHRRTGFPVLPKTKFMFNNGVMPARMFYPTTVKIYNTENYKKAADRIGGDKLNVKVWWQQ
ncbi:SusD/RagB family nutrient-binding outer membrane lipoprotein [Chitinophaga rhizosphaerae]|uniref:SusD/RagB family nutrient-binding outer membrane lipoprotein n=1 Tax=Chitinophaga rhizosphaerae TaxID=1864947 RepID=UPI000F8147EF|nr:SusD/RagB family nutrient-binding outer membrane lipoprotein [Chitinophaga rhizosphaerae]